MDAKPAAAEKDELALIADWERLHAKPPATLYHYTTADGLLGILRNSRLWATNARFMNDPSEIRYAAQLMEQVLEEAAKRHDKALESLEGGFFKKLVVSVRDSMFKVPKIREWASNAVSVVDEQGGAYITCFCKQPDLLSQWRGYAAAGGGYALGFSSKLVARPASGILLRKVIYEPKKQKEIVKRWVDTIFAIDLKWRKEYMQPALTGTQEKVTWQQIVDTWKGASERQKRQAEMAHQGVERLGSALDRFAAFLAECLVCFKNPAYREEQEWRLIQFGRSAAATLYRTRNGAVIPYAELNVAADDTGKLPVRRVTHGPLLEADIARRALKMALSDYGYGDVVNQVSGSVVPYRG